MTAISKVLIMLALWLLYTFVVWRGCSTELCTNCGGGMLTDVPSTDSGAVAFTRYPIDFQWNNPKAFTNEGFEAFRQSILAKAPQNGILEIVGLYFEGESKPKGFDNMGFARAEQVKTLFAGSLPNDRIRLRARALDERDGVREGYFESVLFDWIEPEITATPRSTVEELDDRIIIRFPFGSTEKVYDPKVDDYLAKLAARIKETGEAVTLIGHTDNVGTAERNQELGMARAQAIRSILLRKGAKAEQVKADSKGMTQPVASNDTEEGRHENRRVEVRLIKK